MFEVQFRAKDGLSSRWSTHWTSADGMDAVDHLRQMSLSVKGHEWRMVWTNLVPVATAWSGRPSNAPRE